MTYQQRRDLYRQIEDARDSKVIAYVTGDRPGLTAAIDSDAVDVFIDHLDAIGVVPKISLILYTRGGDPHAARSIANLIRSFCDEFEVIVPSRCQSAGTLLCLGADSIVMTKQAILGPIDPSITTPLNPVSPDATLPNGAPVNVEDVNAYIEQSLAAMPNESIGNAFDQLARAVHPLVIGNAYRTRGQIRMLAQRLLSTHITDRQVIDRVVGFLCKESGSHDYTINRREASNDLGLPVVHPSWEQYELIRDVMGSFIRDLEMKTPLDHAALLGGASEASYDLPCATVESVDHGQHVLSAVGTLRALPSTLEDGRIIGRIIDDAKRRTWRQSDVG